MREERVLMILGVCRICGLYVVDDEEENVRNDLHNLCAITYWEDRNRETTQEDGMLVLTRRVSEAIKIGDGIEVRVLEIHGGQVRIGISAPADVKIFREEIAPATGDDQKRPAKDAS